MQRKNLTIALALLTSTATAWGQANSNSSNVAPNIYVDAANGSDLSPGTQQKPLRTLNQAVNAAVAQSQKGIATKVTVLPGTYRESIAISGSSGAPLTIEAATAGASVVSGADVWTGWTAYSGNSSIYTHSWPYAWGLCAQLPGPTEAPIVRRREMIFVNGTHLTQVLSLSQVTVGTFFVNESNHTVYIWPPSGTKISTATVEVATRPTLLSVDGTKGVTLNGITYEYANGCRNTQPAVRLSNADNAVIENSSFVWNNSMGLSVVSSSGVTINSSQASHNGQTGMFAQYDLSMTYTSDTTSFNNWRGAQGAYYAWNVAGLKFGEVHGANITNFQAISNQCHGSHLDTDNINITVDSLVSADNLNGGIQLEANPGPITLSGGKFCGNNLLKGAFSGGINISDDSHVTVTGSTLYNNNNAEFMVWGRNGGIAVKDFKSGATTQVYNSYFTFDSNLIDATGSQRVFLDSYLTQDWSRLASTLASDYNTWWNASDSSPFIVPVPSGSTSKTFSGWQSLTKQDSHSSFASSSAAAVCSAAVADAADEHAEVTAESAQIKPEAADYWIVANSGSNTVNRGAESSYLLTVIPKGSTGPVSLKADVSEIPDASATWSAESIESSGDSTLTVRTSSSTAAGTYPITVIANSGDVTHTVTVSLVVK